MLKGFQFDKMEVFPFNDSSVFSSLSNDESFVIKNRGNEMFVTSSGLSLNIDTGQALVQGRLIEITEPMSLMVGANFNGYLVIEIDLSQANTSSGTVGQADYEAINNQLSIKTVTNLIKDDLQNNGLIYQFELGKVNSNSNSITFTSTAQVGISKEKLIFSGAVRDIDSSLTLIESFKDFKALIFGISIDSTGTIYYLNECSTLGEGSIRPNLVAPIGTASSYSSVRTYIGLIHRDSETQLSIAYPFKYLTHLSDTNHSEISDPMYVREIWGVR